MIRSISFLTIVFLSCSNPLAFPNRTLMLIRNDTDDTTLLSLKVGTTTFGDIDPGEITAYIDVIPGTARTSYSRRKDGGATSIPDTITVTVKGGRRYSLVFSDRVELKYDGVIPDRDFNQQ
jgi:hypothetical protein